MVHSLKGFFIFLFLLLTMISCGPRSLEDFEEEGEGVIRSLVQDLKAIRTREQLLAASGRLQRQFDRLASLMIAAEEFSISHPEKGNFLKHNHDVSDQLRVELNRLYRLEGGRQIIEKYQEKALIQLDAFHKRAGRKIK